MAAPNSYTASAVKLEALLPRAMSTLFRFSENDPLRRFPVGQIRLLRTLLGSKKTATELCSMLRLSPSSLTQISARLISAGLIEKTNSQLDKRTRTLRLTAMGFELMNQRRLTRARSATAVLSNFDKHKIAALIELLEEVVAHDDVGSITKEAVV